MVKAGTIAREHSTTSSNRVFDSYSTKVNLKENGTGETSSARPYRDLSDAGVASTLRRRFMP